MKADKLLAVPMFSGSCLYVPGCTTASDREDSTWFSTSELKMARPEVKHAVSSGGWTLHARQPLKQLQRRCPWRGCPGPLAWEETAPEYDPLLFCPFTAMGISPVFAEWGRERTASSHRFPPTSSVALDDIFKGSGAEKLLPSRGCLWAMPMSVASAALLQAAHPAEGTAISFPLVVPGVSASFRQTLQLTLRGKTSLGQMSEHPSIITTFTKHPKCFQGSEGIFHC